LQAVQPRFVAATGWHVPIDYKNQDFVSESNALRAMASTPCSIRLAVPTCGAPARRYGVVAQWYEPAHHAPRCLRRRSSDLPGVGPGDACALVRSGAFRCLADLDPHWRMIARTGLAAHGLVHLGREQSRRQLAVEQEMVDA
jgi:hypothetical protein